MRRLRKFVASHRAPKVAIPDELHVCTCHPGTRGVPRDDNTCFHCTKPISPSHDELTRTQGRPIAVVGR